MSASSSTATAASPAASASPIPAKSYGIGARKLDDVLGWCSEVQIPTVTLWVASPENLRRPTAEVSGIFAALQGKMTALASDPRVHRERIRVRAIGKLDLVPEAARAAIRAAEAATSTHDGMVLNIAVAYGGREEIVDFVRAPLADNVREGMKPARRDGGADARGGGPGTGTPPACRTRT